MAKENIQKFYEQLSKSKELQEKILKAQEKCSGDEGRDVILKETVLPLAKETGLEFTEEELKEYERSKITEKGISEEELENVSGGTLISYDYWNNPEAASGAGAIVLPNPILVQPNNSIKIKNMCDVIGFCML